MFHRLSSAINSLWRRRKNPFIVLFFLFVCYITLVPVCRFNDPFSTVITDRNGILLGAKVASDGQWRFPAPDTVPVKLTLATIAFEDRYFMYHPGINPVSTVRALVMNIRHRKVVSGGSTITMQTVRLFRSDKARTIIEKLIEMVMATRMELTHDKEEILSLYVSHAPYGGNVVGANAAAWRYFATSSERLSWAEAATLAVLPNAPSLVHPGRNRQTLLAKRNRLLKKLYDLKWIDRLTLETSLAEELPDKPNAMPSLAPHLLNRVFKLNPGTLNRTTLDCNLQQEVARIIEEHHKRLKYNEIHNMAAIVLEIETGNIVAYIGNCGNAYERNHGNDVDIIRSPRSTGSLLKPLLFAAMIDDGKILPASLIADIPINLGGFAPQNFNGQFEGAVPASRALSRSLNVPAVGMLKNYGTDRFHHLLKALGMSTLEQPASHYGLSLILGGAEGTLEELTNIYASLSRVLKHSGETGQYYTNDYRPAAFMAGKEPTANPALQAEILNASSIWSAFQAMIEVNRPEEQVGWQYFRSSGTVAWKTGTSFGYRDGWAIGLTSAYVVGVWAGNADGEGRPGLTGIAAAAPAMFDIFGLLPVTQWFTKPADEFMPAVICQATGYLAGTDCPDPDTSFIPLTGLNSPACPYHRVIHLSGDLQYRVTSECYSVAGMKHISWFVLPPVQEWYYRKRHIDYKTLPPFKPGCEPAGQRSLDLVYPSENVNVFIPTELQGERGRVIFEAVHRDPDATIYWHLDNDFIGETRFIHQVELRPPAGNHRITLVDENGEELVRNFKVVGPS